MGKVSRALIMAILAPLTVAGAASTNHDDSLDLKIPPGWIHGADHENRWEQSQIIELIRPDEDIHNWKELLTEVSYPKGQCVGLRCRVRLLTSL